jgi:hypothetical protein
MIPALFRAHKKKRIKACTVESPGNASTLLPMPQYAINMLYTDEHMLNCGRFIQSPGYILPVKT